MDVGIRDRFAGGSLVRDEIHLRHLRHDSIDIFAGSSYAGRRGEDETHAEFPAGHRQRAGDVVAIADVGERSPFEITEMLFEASSCPPSPGRGGCNRSGR